MTRSRGKHALWADVLIWAGAAVSFAGLINCVTGGSLWITFGVLPVGLGLTYGGVHLITKDAKTNASAASESAES